MKIQTLNVLRQRLPVFTIFPYSSSSLEGNWEAGEVGAGLGCYEKHIG